MSRVFQILLLGLSAVRAAPHDEATPALRGARALKFGHYTSDPAEMEDPADAVDDASSKGDDGDAVDDASSKGDDGDYGVDNSATAAPTNSFEYVDDAGGNGDDDWWDAY